MTKAIEAGLPKLRIEEAAARRQAAIDSGLETSLSASTSTKPAQQEPLDILSIDNTAVREAQIEATARTEETRDEAKVRGALAGR
jgi:methylmalonyl-CoA mutase